MAADARGRPLRLVLTPGQLEDAPLASTLLNGHSPCRLLADKAYDSNALRSLIAGLELLTKPSFDEAPDDEDDRQGREGEMDVGPSLVADGETTELGEPRQRALDDPPVTSQSLAALDPAPGDAGLDAAAGRRPTAAAVVVGLVSVQLRGTLARRAPA